MQTQPAFASIVLCLAATAIAGGAVPQVWRTRDDIIDGWDWSLPPGVKPDPSSGVLINGRKAGPDFPGRLSRQVNWSWRLLEPEEVEKSLGRATVRTTFKISRLGTIAGCYVTTGLVAKNAKVRLIRDNIVLKDDLGVDSLKHFKDDVRDVKAGLECGVKISGFDDVKVDDVLEFYEIVKVARTLQ